MSDKPEFCLSCGFGTTHLTGYPRRRNINYAEGCETKWLCDLCASTDAGTAVDYPTQYPDIASLRTVCYVGNVILAAIRSRTTERGTGELAGVDVDAVMRRLADK